MKYFLFVSLILLSACTQNTSSVAPTVVLEKNPLSYYDDLRKRCESGPEEKKMGCSASVNTMQKGGYLEIQSDDNGNSIPCPTGMKQNTIRSYGALTWCE